MSHALSSLVAAEERLYALLEPGRPLQARWGKVLASGEEAFAFRKFHSPREKAPSAWKDFLGSASWSLAETRLFKHHELEALPPPARPAAPPLSDKPAWLALCAKAEAAIGREAAHKLVPAREISFALAGPEHEALLAAVAGRLFFPPMENVFRFLVKARGSVFFGATPELLFRREAGMIEVPAIAGTRALAPGVPESSLREELLRSDKDRAEHAWVVDGIRESLEKLGLKPLFPKEPVVLRVPRLLHLYTPVRAADNRAIPGEKLVDALHPTPAIGGLPRAAAAEFLFENEEWDRGLFSAPLLFRSPERELCLVAIRSALLTARSLRFFAGAGYVRGSTPEAEWEETERKLQVMQTVLFGESHGH
jgi:isochorismate synthase EntC